MLNCEVEDILHWGAIGAVKVYLMVDEDRYAEIGNHANFVSDVKKAPGAGYSRPFQKCYRINSFLDAIVTENNPSEPEVLLVGLCQIHRSFIEIAYNLPLDTPLNEWVCFIHGDWASDYYTLWHNEALKPADLYLTKNELNELHRAICNGERLNNKFDTYQIAEQVELEQAFVKAAVVERNSPKKANAVMSLCELAISALKLDDSLINNHFSLQAELNRQLSKRGITEIEGEKTLDDALGKAKSVRKQ